MEEIKEGDVLLDTYQVLSFLGSGTFGKVYKVKVLKGRYAGSVLALKVAKGEETLQYLKKEVQTLLLFNHPHIVSLISYIYIKERGELYILYELMDAGDLRAYILEMGPMEEKDALRVLQHVASGLDYLHRRGYIHGDVKPENIFGKRVLKSLVWKLGDFGLVKIRGSYGILDIKGTVGYIAPEVFRGEIHRSSDVFSLGCVLYFTLTGRDPFDDEDRKEKLRKNKEVIYRIPEGVSDKVKELLTRMLDADHTKRFRTASELLAYLYRI